MDRSEFLRLLRERLPALRDAVNQQQGLLNFEMDVLRKCAQRAIFDGDRQTLALCFALAEAGYRDGDNKVKDGIDKSFVETLDFVTPHNSYLWAWQMLPEALKRLYRDFHGAGKIPKAI